MNFPLAYLRKKEFRWSRDHGPLGQSCFHISIIPHKYCISSIVVLSKAFHSSGKRCNKLPVLTDLEDRRLKRVFRKLGPRGFFQSQAVLDSKTFKKCFGFGSEMMASSRGDDIKGKSTDGAATSGDEGESRHYQDEQL